MSEGDAGLRALAELARLDPEEDQCSALAIHLARMLECIEGLLEVDTTGVDLLSIEPLPLTALRDDSPTPSLPVEQALANAPACSPGGFSVPHILGG